MALEPNNSWLREQPKTNDQQLYVTDAQHHPPAKLLNKPHSQTERFTQTEYRGNCVQVVAVQSHKDSVMFEQNLQQQQTQGVVYSTIEKKDIAPDKGSSVAEFPFCYNVNMIQKVPQGQGGSPTATAVASITTDDKACYRFDVAQPFGYNYTLVNPMSLSATASSSTFKCDVCGLVFAHLSLLNHHKRMHNNNSNESPEQSFPNEQISEGKVHLKTSNKSRTCNRCGVQVGCGHTNGTGKKKGSKYVKCESCQANPTSTTTTLTSNGSFQTSSPEPAEHSPEVVNITSKQLQLVKRHGHGMATVTKCHKCNGSGIIFIGGARSPPPDKPYRCNLCDGAFSRYSSLWSHKRLHTGDKPFKCDMCGLTFARAAYLKNHLRVHSGEKPYKCNVCGMQFSQSPHLKNHERIHSGERPYQCEICEKTFARHSTLWNHRRIHTGEKPYRCSVCGSAFNQATHLKNHAKVHTGEKPHRCDICEVGFSDRFALKRHKLIHQKYGRTNKNDTASSSMVPSAQNQQSTPQIGDIYKCDVAFPGQQPNSSSSSQQSQQNSQSEIYKCGDASTSVAFPGPNSARQPQQQFKCDVGTTVSFAVQPQHSGQSNNSCAQSQATQLNEGYKADENNAIAYQNQQQPPQKQNNSSSVGSQQSTQMTEMYKYDNAFPGQSQQNPPHGGQYDMTPSAQEQQNQQPIAQAPTTQQVSQIPKTIYPRNPPETILGS